MTVSLVCSYLVTLYLVLSFKFVSVPCSFLLLLCFCLISELEGSVPIALLVSSTSGDSDYMSDGVTPAGGSSGSEANTGSEASTGTSFSSYLSGCFLL